MSTEKLEKWALYAFLAASLVGTLWLFAAYLLPVVLPFAAALAFSCFVRPAVSWLSEKTKMRRGFWSAAVILVAGGALVWLLWFGASVLAEEGSAALARLSETLSGEDNPVSTALDRINDFLAKLNIGKGADLSDAATGMLSASLGALSTGAAGFAGRMLSAAPSFVFSFAVFVIALFYFSADKERLSPAVKKLLPPRAQSAMSSGMTVLCKALRRFARAYGMIMLITLAELFAGFLIIGIDFAFLAAILTAIVDVLPVLGAGTVLVPWAVILLLSGESAAGIKMLVLFGVMSAVRQVIEPKIVGKGAGVHPVTAVLFVYAGFKLAGIGGMIIAPIILSAAAILFEVKEEK